MAIVAESYSYVVGVDTHAAAHQYVIIACPSGVLVDTAQFLTTSAGLARAAQWITHHTDGDATATLICAEGTGSYGARLTALMTDRGYRVVDAPSPTRTRGQDKNDKIDALLAARGALIRRTDRLADVRGGQVQSALKTLLAARQQMSLERTRAINALTALVRTHDLGMEASRALSAAHITTIAGWQPARRVELLNISIARTEAVRLATRILHLNTELKANNTHLRALITEHAPALLELVGVGPVNAAVVLSVWSHPGRIRNQAAFANIAGVSPIEVSSGRREEHRLNRGGDRQLNRALHVIAVTRMRCHPETQAYLATRTAQGLTRPRIRRCLKRYIARELHRTLKTTP